MISIPLVTLLFGMVHSERCPEGVELQRLMHEKIRGSSYDGHVPPIAPVLVNMSFWLRDISQVNEMDRNVAILFTVRQAWVDLRLKIDLPDDCEHNYSLPINEKDQGKLWVPSPRMENAIRVTTVSAPLENKAYFVNPSDGAVEMEWFAEMSFPCTPDYAKFPFDRIICDIMFSGWSPGPYFKLTVLPLTFRGKLRLSTFAIEPVKPPFSVPSQNGDTAFVLQLSLRRFYIFFLLQIFIPNLLTVAVAFFSFLFPIDSFRVSLLLSTLITAALQYNAVASSLPKVGYLKGVDIWMLGCVAAIFFGLLGNSLLCMLKNKAEKDEDGMLELWGAKFDLKKILNILDKLVRYSFVILFATFLTIYFVFFVIEGKDKKSALEEANENPEVE